MQLSIGLPTFLLDKDNHTIILFVYLLFLVIVLPTVVGLWWSYKSKLSTGEGDVMANTYKTYAQLLSETLPIRNFMEILGASQEFINLTYSSKEQKEILSYYKNMVKERSMLKPRRYVENVSRTVCAVIQRLEPWFVTTCYFIVIFFNVRSRRIE